MPRRRHRTRVLTLALAAGLLVVAACGEQSQQDARQASSGPEAGEDARAEQRIEGGSGNQSGSITQRAEAGEGGEDGRSGTGSSSSQSSSIVQQSSGGSSSSSQSSSSGSGVKTFSGDGRTTLNFNVEQPSRLSWTNTEGKPFAAHGDGIAIESSAGHGELRLEPRDYDDVEVRGSSWTIIVRPR